MIIVMYEPLKNCVGKIIEKIFLEWFYLDEQLDSIIRLYIKIGLIYDITCCEEDVYIREQREMPPNRIEEGYAYVPKEVNIEWLHKCKITSICFLVDCNSIKRGIVVIFENNHNFVFYNKGYAFNDHKEFEIDSSINNLYPYRLMEI